jgi:protein-S-isoprenylcysteine O-methyltransferase Ste14
MPIVNPEERAKIRASIAQFRRQPGGLIITETVVALSIIAFALPKLGIPSVITVIGLQLLGAAWLLRIWEHRSWRHVRAQSGWRLIGSGLLVFWAAREILILAQIPTWPLYVTGASVLLFNLIKWGMTRSR